MCEYVVHLGTYTYTETETLVSCSERALMWSVLSIGLIALPKVRLRGEVNVRSLEGITVMRAIGANVVVRRVLRKGVSEGGIAIPEQHREIPNQGVITSVGSGYINNKGDLIPLNDLHVADRVMFVRRSGQITRTLGKELRVLPYDTIVAVLVTDEAPLVLCPRCKGDGVVTKRAKP